MTRCSFPLRSVSAWIFLLALIGPLLGCTEPADNTSADNPSKAESIIDQAIDAHGGDVLDNAVVTLNFRGDRFRIRRDDGRFRYTRTYTDSLDRTVREVLTNDSLYRTVEGERVDLSDAERRSVETDVNSVTYFALLPYFLQAPAVQPEHTGTDTIDGTPYHRIRVTFRRDGGGRDWDDTFMYWFDQNDGSMDYLAYSYGNSPDEEYGTRFREAYNVRRVEGVRFADYMNYTTPGDSLRDLTRYSEFHAQDSLELVSRVELDSVQVQPLGD